MKGGGRGPAAENCRHVIRFRYALSGTQQGEERPETLRRCPPCVAEASSCTVLGMPNVLCKF